MGFFASIDGIIAPAAEARISILDNGFTFGDAVYETLRTYGGRPFAVDRHLRRLRASAARIGVAIPVSDAELEARLEALLARAGNAESFIRWIVSRGVGDISYHFDRVKGPTIAMVVKPFEAFPDGFYTEGIPVTLVSIRRNHPDALDPAIKSCNLLNNVLATQEAQSKGGFEALLLNQAGELAEGAGSNVFVVKDGEALTPPLSAGILAGITRELLFELATPAGVRMREASLTAADLFDADEAFVTSSLKELGPIRSVNGRAIRTCPGPVTRTLLAAYRSYAHSHGQGRGLDETPG